MLPAMAAVRVREIDWLRGIVMVVMTLDHASGVLNAGHMINDSAFFYAPGTALPLDQFLTRWISHLCAPTFVFLAGAALALSVERRVVAGEAPGRIDRAIVARGLVLLALEVTWMSLAFRHGSGVLLQVLYALGGAMIAMALLRRLPGRVLVIAGLALVVGGELLVGLVVDMPGQPTMPGALLLSGGHFGWLTVAYPLIPWLAIMMLGWAWGGGLRARPPRPRGLALAGLASLGVFVAVRGYNGFGNMLLPRDDGSFVQWLHVSKYPPSLSFMALELGLMALLLALLTHLRIRGADSPVLRVLETLGSVALFYYLLHVPLLELAGAVVGKSGLAAAYLGSAVCLVALYPLCVVYRRYKAAHPHSFVRYI